MAALRKKMTKMKKGSKEHKAAEHQVAKLQKEIRKQHSKDEKKIRKEERVVLTKTEKQRADQSCGSIKAQRSFNPHPGAYKGVAHVGP